MRRNVFDDDFEPKPEVKKQLRSERVAKRRFLRSDGEADPSYRIPLDVLLAG